MENLFHQIVNSININSLFIIALCSLAYFVITYHIWKLLANRRNLQEQTSKAVDLFKERYDKTPSEAGFPIIGIYERQSAYLYATSRKVIKSYRMQQNIIRWLMLWYLWPFPIIFIGTTMTMMKYTSLTHPSFVAWCSFAAIWSILGFVLCAKALIASRIVKFNENVTYLNY
ncbi:MAG: hypothetical protein E7020_00710 [Alphaproteobacteria bacterium]|nr:hypothetical protein [Alphaproteobacteria bacterium]